MQGGDKPGQQTLQVAACKNLELTAAAGDGARWLTLATADGENGVTPVTLAVDPGSLEPGEYNTTVTVSAPDVFFGPIQVPVTLRVQPPPPPPGDTPSEQPQPPAPPAERGPAL